MTKEGKKSDSEYYDDYLKWIKDKNINALFDPETGIVGVLPGESFIKITENCFPVYDYNRRYMGYVSEGKFIKMESKELSL